MKIAEQPEAEKNFFSARVRRKDVEERTNAD